MSTSASTICSPSSRATMRMIPCIAGCAGPTLSSMSRVSSASEAAAAAGTELSGMVRGMAVWPDQWLPFVDRIVFSQRMTDELLVSQNALQVRVSSESDAEHVPHFALEPVRARPERRLRIDLRVVLLQRNADDGFFPKVEKSTAVRSIRKFI